MKKEYMAKFALVFYGFLMFGNMINFIYQLPYLSVAGAYFTVFNSFLFNRVFVGNTKLSTTCASIFSHLFLLKSLSTI